MSFLLISVSPQDWIASADLYFLKAADQPGQPCPKSAISAHAGQLWRRALSSRLPAFCDSNQRDGKHRTDNTYVKRKAREFRSWIRIEHLQLGNAIVGAAEPPAKLAIDVLHHDHIRMDVGLVIRIELPGRELVQHGWTLRNHGG